MGKRNNVVICCPVCGKEKIRVYSFATGIITFRCACCRRIIEWNLEKRTAKRIESTKY